MTHITNTPRAGESDAQAAARSNRRGDNQLEVSDMNEMPRHIDEHMSREIADEMAKLNRQSGNPNVEHPRHYNAHPSGVECITVTEHMNFNLGNAVKYIWRAGLKSEDAITDLEKARWYVEREIARLERGDR